MRFIRAGVVGLMVMWMLAPVGRAQLIRVEGEGSLEHLENAGAVPAFLPGPVEVWFDFRMDGVAGDGFVTFPAEAAVLRIGDERRVLRNAALEVWRSPSGAEPFTSYLLRGETSDGWWFSLQNDFAAAENGAGFPRLLVSPAELLVHDVLLRAGDFDWAAYGDGVITSIGLVTAPEPATYAIAGVAMLGVSVVLRRRVRRRTAV
mgnify:CR=1 FL=1|jgi:hypothetical protein